MRIDSKEFESLKKEMGNDTALGDIPHYSILVSRLLKKYWGYDSFRGVQEPIIHSIIDGHDTLGLMPTGGGKSIAFQVPAMLLEGVCVVITPLVALMKDQVAHLKAVGIRAAAIHASLSHSQVLTILDNAVFGALKLLYVSPERLASELFITKLSHMQVSFICVDEAHCISQWGYDFRPSYLELQRIREIKPDAPVLALTATATPEVVKDIQQKLSHPDRIGAPFNVFSMSFERKNLAYVVRETTDKPYELIHILESVKGSAIVYTRSREKTKIFAKMLCDKGINALYFHAGLDDADKDHRQQDWQTDKVRVMVATNAFGMGIDKPDVRLVVHVDCPNSLEEYFQEAGRAGRDGKKAYAVLLHNGHDNSMMKTRITDAFPDKAKVREIYDKLAYFYQVAVGSGYMATFEFNIDKFCHIYKQKAQQVEASLQILQRAGYISYQSEDNSKSRIRFLLDRDDLYRLRNSDPDEEKVIEGLLRNYTGMFSDYQYIDLGLVEYASGLSPTQVYLILKSLNSKRIISFIPQRNVPRITYLQRREESRHLYLGKEVYDSLKTRFEKRIEAMIDYSSSGNICRSRMLLAYFGEVATKDCGRCDVCLSRKGEGLGKKHLAEAASKVMQLLADGKPHEIAELRSLGLPKKQLEAVIDDLRNEEKIFFQGFSVSVCPQTSTSYTYL